MKVSVIVAFVAAILTVTALTPMPGYAQTRADVYNGATCIPYPPFNSQTATPFRSWLYAYGQSAYCHITMPDGWRAIELSYVLFTGSTQSSAHQVRVRLCLYDGGTASCGLERTVSGSYGINWVAPPSPLPSYASGAYLNVRFPVSVSRFFQFIPVWSR